MNGRINSYRSFSCCMPCVWGVGVGLYDDSV